MDSDSPITTAGEAETGTNATVSVTLADAGEYPFFCTNHASMAGTIFVE